MDFIAKLLTLIETGTLKVFVDVDETLVKAVRWPGEDRPNRLLPSDRQSDALLVFRRTTGMEKFSLFFRPDIDLLKGIPFSLCSSGTREFVTAIAGILRLKGFRVEGEYSDDDLATYDQSNDELTLKPAICDGPCVLIDDLWSLPDRMAGGLETKLKKLPRARHLQVHPLRMTRGDDGQGMLVISSDRDSQSLEACLRAACEQV